MRSDVRTPKRPSLGKRIAALLMATLLCFGAAADAVSAHDCPHHGLSAAHAGMAGMAGHGTDHSMPGHDAHHGGCTCIGVCAGAGAAPSPAMPTVLTVAREILVEPAQATPIVRSPAHLTLIPFATAPPLA